MAPFPSSGPNLATASSSNSSIHLPVPSNTARRRNAVEGRHLDRRERASRDRRMRRAWADDRSSDARVGSSPYIISTTSSSAGMARSKPVPLPLSSTTAGWSSSSSIESHPPPYSNTSVNRSRASDAASVTLFPFSALRRRYDLRSILDAIRSSTLPLAALPPAFLADCGALTPLPSMPRGETGEVRRTILLHSSNASLAFTYAPSAPNSDTASSVDSGEGTCRCMPPLPAAPPSSSGSPSSSSTERAYSSEE
mmetsp:Transcript_36474/g.109576  ORF Transcript_36474/g.109576 Transcript_36474/m.109576 type:complete len:253 (+) Transcript_36474:641-1399(+)